MVFNNGTSAYWNSQQAGQIRIRLQNCQAHQQYPPYCHHQQQQQQQQQHEQHKHNGHLFF